MPLTDAIAMLHRTSRLYKDATTLVDPRTGEEFKTLLPGAAPRMAPAVVADLGLVKAA